MPKSRVLILAICIAVSLVWLSSAYAQCPIWSRTYGGSGFDELHSVQQTTDGGYIAVGYTWSFGAGNADVYVIRTDSTGDTLWTKTYGASDFQWGTFVQQTADRGYILTGHTDSTGGGDRSVSLTKTDSLGNCAWSRTYGGAFGWHEGWSVDQTTDGGYIVTGYTWPFGAGAGDVYLIKTDSTGDTLWTRTYGGTSLDAGLSGQQTTDGGYIVVGWTNSFGAGGGDIYLIKTDAAGDTMWTRTYGGSVNDLGNSVQETSDGGYILAGETASFGSGGDDFYLVKTDSKGGIVWSRTYGGAASDRGFSVRQTADGGYIAVGHTWSFGAGKADVYVIKTDSSGSPLWIRTYGDSLDDFGYSVQQTSDEGYVVAGCTWSFGAVQGDVMLTKLDSQGNACIGGSVASTVLTSPCTAISPPTVVTSPPTVVTSPLTTVMSPATGTTILCGLQRGDCNKDGEINVADVTYLINYLFAATSPPDPLWLGDANCDVEVNVADVIYLINYLFLGGSPPCC